MSFLSIHQFEICFLALGSGTLLMGFHLRGWMGKRSLTWSFNFLAVAAIALAIISRSERMMGYLFLCLFLVILRDALKRAPGIPASNPTSN